MRAIVDDSRLAATWRMLRYSSVAAFSAAVGWVALANGSVNDEFAAHIAAGYLYLTTGRFAGGVYNPPLGQLWVAWPQVLVGEPLFPFTESPPVLSRLANTLLACVLALSVGAYVERRAGVRAAALSTLVLVTTPEFMAHAALATLELPVTAWIFWAIVAWLELQRRWSWKRCAIVGLATGAAMATKISALLLGPIFLVLVLAAWVGPAHRRLQRMLPAKRVSAMRVLGSATVIAGTALGILWACYGFRSSHDSAGQSLGQEWAGLWRLVPADYLNQLLGKARYANDGNLAYLFGKTRPGGWWWYYPVVLALKTPMPTLALWLWASYHVLTRRASYARSLILAAGVFLVCAIFNRAQIGVRHLLPVVPLLAAAAGVLAEARAPWQRRLAWGLGVLSVLEAGAVVPYPLTAESRILLGSGYRVFADSNYDWGQANGAIEATCEKGLGTRPAPFTPTTGTLVVRVNELAGFRQLFPNGYAWLRPFEPTARICGAGLVFQLDELTSEALGSSAYGKLTRAVWLASRGKLDLAAQDFEAALAEGVPPRDVFLPWVSWVERYATPIQAYRLAHRATLLAPRDGQLRNTAQRLASLIEASKWAADSPARSAFARANACLVAGQFLEAHRWSRSARDLGAPPSACDQLEYRAACLLGYWPLAARIARKASLDVVLSLDPPWRWVDSFVRDPRETSAGLALASWCYERGAWKTSAEVLCQLLACDPADPRLFNLLGELVVRYKEGTLGIAGREKRLLELVSLRGTSESN